MAHNTRETKRSSRDSWVPAGLNGGSAAANGEDAVEDWLPAPKQPTSRGNGRAARNGSRAGGAGAGNGSAPERASEGRAKPDSSQGPRRRHRLPKHASPRERWLIFRLRRSRKREEELQEKVEELRSRISELEVEARPANGNGTTAKRQPSNGKGSPRKPRPAVKKPTAARARRAPARTVKTTRPRKTSKLDLNAATFDQLRGLGLTINQTSRVISHREHAGGFAQVKELEEIRGLSRAKIAEIRSRVRVGSR